MYSVKGVPGRKSFARHLGRCNDVSISKVKLLFALMEIPALFGLQAIHVCLKFRLLYCTGVGMRMGWTLDKRRPLLRNTCSRLLLFGNVSLCFFGRNGEFACLT